MTIFRLSKLTFQTLFLFFLSNSVIADCSTVGALLKDVEKVLECELNIETEEFDHPSIEEQISFWDNQARVFEDFVEFYQSKNLPSLVKISENFHQRALLAARDMRLTVDSGNVCNLAAYKGGAWNWHNSKEPKLSRIDIRSENRNSACASTQKISSLNLEEEIGAACGKPKDSCEETLNIAEQLILELKKSFNVADKISEKVITKITQRVTEKNKKIQQYLFDSKPLWPWEIAINDFVYDRYGDSYSEGFRRPPKRQIIVLHPSVGFEWINDAPRGERLAPSVYIELIGINYWDKNHRLFESPILSSLSGISAAVTLTDREGVSTVGAGPLFTFSNRFEVGINYYHQNNEVGILFGFNLMNLWRDKYQSLSIKSLQR